VSWNTQISGTSEALYEVYFKDINYGWAVGDIGTVLKTTNGGTIWEDISIATTTGFSSVYFIDLETGWISGFDYDEYFGRILKTTNGGMTWNEQWNGSFSHITSIYFDDSNTGWAVGDHGVILNTTDSGENWVQQSSLTSARLSSIHFVDSKSAWIVGSGGTILHTTNGGVSFIDKEEIDEIPTNYSLTNNFPNPFNPITKIRYSVPQSSSVVIKVFDILGNEIETLVNEEKSVGTYEITWYAENLPSGIYFYRLQAGSFAETKKMILIK